MANSSSTTTFLAAACLILAALVAAEAAAITNQELNYSSAPVSCQGTIAECMGRAEEMAMDSETNRRILATTDYISYEALESNTVPCSERGASYYNCQKGAEANPYNRGCSQISQCRS